MAVKVAINGFGRIGRLALRLMADHPEFDVVAMGKIRSRRSIGMYRVLYF